MFIILENSTQPVKHSIQNVAAGSSTANCTQSS